MRMGSLLFAGVLASVAATSSVAPVQRTGGSASACITPAKACTEFVPVGTGSGQCVALKGETGCQTLTGGEQIDISDIAYIDPGKGKVEIQSIVGIGNFYGGRFNLAELAGSSRRSAALASTKPVLLVGLVGGNFRTCPKGQRSISSSGAAQANKPVRRLWGKGKGRFRMSVPDPIELAQLRRFTQKPELQEIDEPITALVLRTANELPVALASLTTAATCHPLRAVGSARRRGGAPEADRRPPGCPGCVLGPSGRPASSHSACATFGRMQTVARLCGCGLTVRQHSGWPGTVAAGS